MSFLITRSAWRSGFSVARQSGEELEENQGAAQSRSGCRSEPPCREGAGTASPYHGPDLIAGEKRCNVCGWPFGFKHRYADGSTCEALKAYTKLSTGE